MGRIKTRRQKRATKDILEKHAEKFSPDFEQNKKALAGLASFRSKKLRNVIAGYASRLKKAGKY